MQRSGREPGGQEVTGGQVRRAELRHVAEELRGLRAEVRGVPAAVRVGTLKCKFGLGNLKSIYHNFLFV